jgi:hypothetical protein
MNKNQFQQILQEVANTTNQDAENIWLYRYNDKRKDHRRIAFKCLVLKYSTLFENVAEQLQSKGCVVEFDNTKHVAYGTVVSIFIKVPLTYSCKSEA